MSQLSPYMSDFARRVPLFWSRCTGNNGISNGTTDQGGTSRCGFQTVGTTSDLQIFYENYYNLGSGEINAPNPITIISVLEYPANTFYECHAVAGATANFVNANGQTAYTLPAGKARARFEGPGLTITGSLTQVNVRTHVMLSLPPTNFVATGSASGGTLAAATYNYTISQVAGPQGESGPSSTQSVTTTGSTSSVALSWTFNTLAVPNTAVNIYRGNLLLVTLPANTTSYTDTGAVSVGTKSSVAAQKFPFGGALNQNTILSGQGHNYGSSSGTGINQTLTSGTAWEINTSFAYTPSEIQGIPATGLVSVISMTVGDSIAEGQNSNYDLGYINTAHQAALIPYHHVPRASEETAYFIGALGSMRLTFAEQASDAVVEYGINDTWFGVSQATIQANLISIWTSLAQRGVCRIHQAMLTPRVQSVDTMETLAGQSPGNLSVTSATNATPIVITANGVHGYSDGSPTTIIGVVGNTAANVSGYAKVTGYSTTTFGLYQDAGLTTPIAGSGAYTSGGFITPNPTETTRKNMNLWYQDGCPLNPSTLTAQPVGTANGATCVRAPVYSTGGTVLVTAGYGNHPLASVFNPCLNLEVNSAGVLTFNGGYWPVNGTANWASESTHPSNVSVALMWPQVPTALMTPQILVV